MRRRILLLVSCVTLLVVLAFAIPLAVLIDSQVVQRQENRTVAVAAGVAAFIGGTVGAQDTPAISASAIQRYVASLPQGRRVQVTMPNGMLIGSLPESVLAAAHEPDHQGSGDGEHPPGIPPPTTSLTSVAGGRLATTFVPAPFGHYDVRVFVSNDELHAGEAGWWLLLVGGSVALLLVGIGAGELVTRRITRPLVQVAETAHRLSAGDVTARAHVEGPSEVAAVGAALNRLADRIDQLIEDERETVADLSHRLRTPLTALRLDAESLDDPVEAERISTHASTLERMLTAVIRAARRPQREGRMPSCDATQVVRERVRFWSALTDEQHRMADVALPSDPMLVRAAAEDLGAAIDALLENVVAHTPEGTAFSVSLRPDHADVVLEIGDSGPGIPPDAVLRGRSDRGSTGLGLDIARRCAEGSGGSMEIGRSTAGGAVVRLRLGAP
jgi:signal transduction histidine kinase